jgi:hypothetical protein
MEHGVLLIALQGMFGRNGITNSDTVERPTMRGRHGTNSSSVSERDVQHGLTGFDTVKQELQRGVVFPNRYLRLGTVGI